MFAEKPTGNYRFSLEAAEFRSQKPICPWWRSEWLRHYGSYSEKERNNKKEKAVNGEIVL